MDVIQEERKKNIYSYDTFLKNILEKAIQFEKINDHEKRITDLESGQEKLFELIGNKRITKDNQFITINQNTKHDAYAHQRIKEERIECRLEGIVSELAEVEDKKFQVQIVGELVDEIRGMLKEIPKQKNNYRRKTLLMFHEALKQNYVKNLFSETQIRALAEVARVCNQTFVTKEQYFEMDNILCECDLDMMPDLE